MLVVDSSSANVNGVLLILFSVKKISGSVVKIDSSQGSFFLRVVYLQNFSLEELELPFELSQDEETEVLDAGLAYAAEKDAMNYLARAEHSAFLLKQKLLKKEHSESSIEKAFVFLRNANYLSDSRYAEAFLRNRSISRTEGRTRLMSELSVRGINREIAKTALDDFFEMKSEHEILVKAVEKQKRLGKEGDKLVNCLIRMGFSFNDIKKVLTKDN